MFTNTTREMTIAVVTAEDVPLLLTHRASIFLNLFILLQFLFVKL